MTMYLRYLWYILRHKWFVFVECVKVGLPLRGIIHDLSKLRPDEFIPYARYFYGKWEPRSRTLLHASLGVSVRYKEDVERDFDAAWNRHQKRNSHHWQYWILSNDDGTTKVLKMSHIARREMLADWRGTGRTLRKPDTKAWYLVNRDKMQLYSDTRAWIECSLFLHE